MTTYQTPALTRIGSFRRLTRAFGNNKCKDILGIRALFSPFPWCN